MMLPDFLNTGNWSMAADTTAVLPPAWVSFVNQFVHVPFPGNCTARELDALESRGATRMSAPSRYVVSSVKVMALELLSNAAEPAARRYGPSAVWMLANVLYMSVMAELVALSYLQQLSQANVGSGTKSAWNAQPRRVGAVPAIFHERTKRSQLQPTHKQQRLSDLVSAVACNVRAEIHVPSPENVTIWRCSGAAVLRARTCGRC